MKVIVNNSTPLTVEDEKGDILYQWLPENKDDTIKISVNRVKSSEQTSSVDSFIKEVTNWNKF